MGLMADFSACKRPPSEWQSAHHTTFPGSRSPMGGCHFSGLFDRGQIRGIPGLRPAGGFPMIIVCYASRVNQRHARTFKHLKKNPLKETALDAAGQIE